MFNFLLSLIASSLTRSLLYFKYSLSSKDGHLNVWFFVRIIQLRIILNSSIRSIYLTSVTFCQFHVLVNLYISLLISFFMSLLKKA